MLDGLNSLRVTDKERAYILRIRAQAISRSELTTITDANIIRSIRNGWETAAHVAASLCISYALASSRMRALKLQRRLVATRDGNFLRYKLA